MIVAQLIGQGISAVVTILMQRYLGPAESGTLRFVTSFGIIFAVLTELGISRAVIIVMAGNDSLRRERLWGDLIILRGLISLIYLGIVWGTLFALAPIGEYDQRVILLVIIWSVSVVFQGFRRNAEAMFLGMENMLPHSVLVVCSRILSALMLSGVIFFKLSLEAVVLSLLAVDVVDSAISWILLRRRLGPPVFEPDGGTRKEMLRIGWPFSLQMLANQVYLYINALLLKHMLPGDKETVNTELGYYGAAFSIIMVLILIPANLGNALFPAMSRAYSQQDLDQQKTLLRNSTTLNLTLGAFISLFFYVFRSEIVVGLLGHKFGGAVPVLAVLCWVLIFAFINVIMGTLFSATGRQHAVNVGAFACSGVSVISSLLLIPHLGTTGSAWAILSAEAFNAGILIAFLVYFYRTLFPWVVAARILAVQGAVVLLFLYLDGFPFPLRAIIFAVYAMAVGVALRYRATPKASTTVA